MNKLIGWNNVFISHSRCIPCLEKKTTPDK